MTIRQTAPEVLLPTSLPVLDYITNHVGPLPIYAPRTEDEEILRITFLFDSGNIRAQKHALASAVNKLMLSGTSSFTSTQLHEKLDFYGSYIELDHSQEESAINVYCLKTHLSQILPIVHHIIADNIFPEEEIEIYKNRSIEMLKVNLEKTSFIAKRHFMQTLFYDTVYGRVTGIEDYEMLGREEIVKFHSEHYQQGLKYILLSSYVEPSLFDNFQQFYTDEKISFPKVVFNYSERSLLIPKAGAMQASIIVGMPWVHRSSPEYSSLAVLNTIFGGYFGSRLMKNIREEKGFTYGIGSGVHSMHDTGYLSVRTDVNNDVKEQTVEEIFKEIERLKNESVSDAELQTVKSYMVGSLQRNFDGSLALCDRYKTVLDYDLEADHYQKFLETVLNITPQEIHKLAQQHYVNDKMLSVIVGEFN